MVNKPRGTRRDSARGGARVDAFGKKKKRRAVAGQVKGQSPYQKKKREKGKTSGGRGENSPVLRALLRKGGGGEVHKKRGGDRCYLIQSKKTSPLSGKRRGGKRKDKSVDTAGTFGRKSFSGKKGAGAGKGKKKREGPQLSPRRNGGCKKRRGGVRRVGKPEMEYKGRSGRGEGKKGRGA